MFWFLNLLYCLTFIWNSWAVDIAIPSLPHTDCPLIDDINHAIMLPYPQDCNKYYSCFKGKAYLQQCPNNLHWSQLTYRCDYPEVAKCQIALLPNLEANFTGEILYQLNPTDCSSYAKCQVMACPINYYWSSLTQKCDFPHNANCPFMSAESMAKDINSNMPHISYNTANMDESFNQPYFNDCSKFYKCQILLCPVNYHWNYRTNQCDLPQLAQCQSPSQLPETSTAVIPTAFTPPAVTLPSNGPTENSTIECQECLNRCEDYIHHYLPHPYDCHKFIQCNGWSYIHTCPDNLFWNAKLNTCDRVCVTI